MDFLVGFLTGSLTGCLLSYVMIYRLVEKSRVKVAESDDDADWWKKGPKPDWDQE